MQELKGIYYADISAFNSYLDDIRLPKNTEEEKNIRMESLQNALQNACDVSIHFGDICMQILKLNSECAKRGNKNVISDASVGIHLIHAAVVSAFEGFDLNIKTIKDGIFIEKAQQKKAEILSQIQLLSSHSFDIISER